MTHSYISYTVRHRSGNAVQFTSEDDAIDHMARTPEAMRMEPVKKETPCSKPQRGYCAVCYPFREHGRFPDYVPSNEPIEPNGLWPEDWS